MRSLLQLFGLEPRSAGSDAETDTVRKITERLDQLPVEEARYIAAFAYILGRVANADLEISPEETRSMERIVVQEAGLPKDQAINVVQIAKSQNRLFGGTENFLVTQEFNKLASRDQKLALLRCLFAVSSADRRISVVEDNEIRQISRELRLDHRDFIEVRHGFRDYLAVLQKDGDDGQS